MSFWSILLLAVVQGLAELLPVSSSAHVVVAEKLLGLDPSSPSMTLFLIMLHTGTMFAVVVYFWRQWRATYFQNMAAFKKFAGLVLLASFLTGLVGLAIIKITEHTFFRSAPHAQIEDLFSHLEIVAPALALVGLLSLWAGIDENRKSLVNSDTREARDVQVKSAALIGIVQGLSLPFRGFSRSGSTISVGMLLGVAKANTERFSFALAVAITPVVFAREATRLIDSEQLRSAGALTSAFFPGLLGALFAFLAGLLALRWLSGWLESGRWYLFGIYCLVASFAVGYIHHLGY